VLQPLGLVLLGMGDVAQARVHLEEGLALARELGDKRDIAAAMNNLAQLYRFERHLDIAEPLYESVVSLGEELGDRETLAVGLLNLAMVSVARGATERATDTLLQVVDIAVETGSKPAGQSVLEVSTALAALQGDLQSAARFYGAAEAHTVYTGIRRDPADEAFLAPLVAKLREALGETSFAGASLAGKARSYEDAMSEVRGWLERTRTSPPTH